MMLDRALRRVEKLLMALACATLFAIMALVFTDVCLRYLFNAPLSFSYDLISLYLMVVVFFFGVSDTLRHNEHVAVDILHNRAAPRVKAVFDTITYAVSFPLFSLIFWTGLKRFLNSYAASEVLAGTVPWPAWLSYAIVPIGTLPIAILCLARLVQSVTAALRSNSVATSESREEGYAR